MSPRPSKPKAKQTTKPAARPSAAKGGDPLATYAAKRDFAVTSEPAPAPPRSEGRSGPPTFMVHKHDARRLHYDLRLEMDGVLASWAIPKGPSYDPAERHLAVETEDHPFEYGSFEGRIPDGEYGGGDSIIWDRGVFETVPPGQQRAMRAKGHLHIVLMGEKLRGGWHLVRTRGSGTKADWIIFKAKDETARPGYDVIADRPESVVSGRKVTRGPVPERVREGRPDPMRLLLRVWPPPPRTSTISNRALAAVSHGLVALQSAEGRDLAAARPDLVRALATLPVFEAVLDGDLDEPRFVASDLLWLDGEDQRPRPVSERRELMATLLAGADGARSLVELASEADDAPPVKTARRPSAPRASSRRGKPKAAASRTKDPAPRR